MGDYELVSHMETPECSLRLLRLTKDKYIQLHHHHKTNQIYFVLDESIQASVGIDSLQIESPIINLSGEEEIFGFLSESPHCLYSHR